MDYTTISLGSLMSFKDPNIRRQAIAIFKMLPTATHDIGKAYIEDAITRANDIDRTNFKDKTKMPYCSSCNRHADPNHNCATCATCYGLPF